MRWLMPLAALAMLGCGSAAAAVACSAPLPANTTATGRCLTMSLQTDRDSYSPGQKLSVTVTGTNNTSAACGGARELVCGGPALAIRDASGTAVFTRQPPVRVCPMLIRLLQPGETQQMTVAIELPALAPGIYSLVAAPGAEALGSHYFRIC